MDFRARRVTLRALRRHRTPSRPRAIARVAAATTVRARRARCRTLAAALLASICVASARGQTPPNWTLLLQHYVESPSTSYRELLHASQGDLHQLPPLVVLATADAALRAGRLNVSRQYFEEAVTRDLGMPWNTLAHLGYGWLLLLSGDDTTARQQYEMVQDGPGRAPILAQLMVALLDSAAGNYDGARPVFERIAADERSGTTLIAAATLSNAYGLYWAGRYDQAARAFDAALPSSETWLVDDARFGAAMATLRAGRRDEGIERLSRMTAGLGKASGHVVAGARAMKALDWDTLLHTGIARYRPHPVGPPEELARAVLDLDGEENARAVLRYLRHEGQAMPAPAEPAITVGDVRAAVPEPDAAPSVRPVERHPPIDASSRHETRPRASWPWAPLVATLLLLVTAVIWWRRRRTGGHP